MTITPLLSPKETADRLGICIKTLKKCRDLGLRYVDVTPNRYKYREDDLREYIENRTTKQCRSEKRVRKTGTTISATGVVDFADLAKRRITKKPN